MSTELVNARTAIAQASAKGVGRSLKKARLEKALQAFNRALTNISPIDFASFAEATHGLLSTAISLLECQIEEGISKTNMGETKYFVTQTFDALTRVVQSGPAGQALDTSDQVIKALQGLLQTDLVKLNKEEKQSFFRWIQETCLHAPRSVRKHFRVVAFEASLDLGEALFHEALSEFENGRWAKALSIIKSYESGIVVAVEYEERLDSSNGRAKYLSGDFAMLLVICQGSQLLKSGDSHWDRAINGDPDDLWGNAQLAQDDYRLALACVTEKDIELEGATLTKLARFSLRVAKVPSVAHQIFLRAVQLAMTLAPKQPKGTWYTEAIAAVQKYRDDLWAAEQQGWTEKRKPIVEKLKSEIGRLDERQKSAERKCSETDYSEFVTWVWTEWPPKTEGPKDLPSLVSPKKLVLKAMQRYHADKNPASVYGEEWAVMAEEISKALGSCYNMMKEMD